MHVFLFISFYLFLSVNVFFLAVPAVWSLSRETVMHGFFPYPVHFSSVPFLRFCLPTLNHTGEGFCVEHESARWPRGLGALKSWIFTSGSMGPTYSLPLWSEFLFTPQQRAEYPMSDAPCSRSTQHSSACYRNRAGITSLMREQKPYPVWFYVPELPAVWREHSLGRWRLRPLLLLYCD